MSNWQRLKVPYICERIIGFSIPTEQKVFVISYEGAHLLYLEKPEVVIETEKNLEEYKIYNPDLGTARFRGQEYQIIGLHGGKPILNSAYGENLVLDEDSETLSITQNDKTVFSMKYENFSGDWVKATFSQDGEFIILGCPYDSDFIVLKRNLSEFTKKDITLENLLNDIGEGNIHKETDFGISEGKEI